MNKLYDLEKSETWGPLEREIMSNLPAQIRQFHSGELGSLNFLRLLFIQRVYGLNEMALEDKLIDRPSFRRFAGIKTAFHPEYSIALREFKRQLENSGAFELVMGSMERVMNRKSRTKVAA